MGEPSPIGMLGIYLGDSSAPRSQTVITGNFTNRTWAELVLLNIEYIVPQVQPGAPLLTTNNINNMVVWMNQENNINNKVQPNGAGSWWGQNNPLNNSLGSKSMGLGPYPDLTTAAWMTAMEIVTVFPAIVAGLSSNASPAAFSKAVVSSGWACGRYGVQAAGSDNCLESNHVTASPYWRPPRCAPSP